jgi:hypothetical protein
MRMNEYTKRISDILVAMVTATTSIWEYSITKIKSPENTVC